MRDRRIPTRLVVLLLVLSVVMLAFSAVGTVKGQTLDTLTMESGAYVRKSSKYEGLQFGARVSDSLYQEVESNENKCFGGIIIPCDWFNEYGVAAGPDTDYVKEFEAKGAPVSSYQRDGLFPTIIDQNVYVFLTISNLYYKNLNRDYFGIIYVKTTGQPVTYEYASFTDGDNVGNAVAVAEAGLANDPANEKLYRQYVKKGEILANNPDITLDDFNLAYETYEFEEVVASLPSGENMLDGEAIKYAESVYEKLSQTAKSVVQTEYATLCAVKTAYAQKYVMATDISSAPIAEEISKNTYADFQNSVTLLDNVADEEYGTTQALSLDLTGCTKKHVIFKISAFEAIKAQLANYPSATVEFYIKDNVASHTWYFGSEQAPFANSSKDGENDGVSKTMGDANTWVKVTFTADEFLTLTGEVSVLRKATITSVQISNIYIVLP